MFFIQLKFLNTELVVNFYKKANKAFDLSSNSE